MRGGCAWWRGWCGSVSGRGAWYDLEDVDPAEAMSSPGYDVSAANYEAAREGLERQGSLPSFPMEEDGETRPASRRPSAPAYEARVSARPGGDLIEDALEGAEFF